MERHLFPGANTPRGFVSLFSSIPAPGARERTVILKGGPGVGKSTCMKRTAQAAREAGLAVEYFHCSSDPDSLDAVRIPAARLIMVDGTAPHGADANDTLPPAPHPRAEPFSPNISHTYKKINKKEVYTGRGLRYNSQGIVFRCNDAPQDFLPGRCGIDIFGKGEMKYAENGWYRIPRSPRPHHP